jgi:uncharacterized damage-inducible protein DinB
MQETPQQYIQRMLGLVEGKDPLQVQKTTAGNLAKLIQGLDKQKLTRRPAPGTWSMAEILAHLADAEVVAAWRLRLVLGQNGATIQSFDQNVWAETFNYERRDPRVSLETFRVLRMSNLLLLESIPEKLWENYGTHQERGKETVAHIVSMYAGHDLNHLRQVEAIAKDACL